jgi:transcriptional regulator with XRE-family HTH domain
VRAHRRPRCRQLTAARALADLTIIELAEAAGVTRRTVQRLEMGGEQPIAKKRRHGHVSGEAWAKIVAAFKRHGVELLPETEGHGAGVRWIQPRAQRPQNWPLDLLKRSFTLSKRN